METNTTGQVKVATKKEENVLISRGELFGYDTETYKSSFKISYNPESNNTQFFLEVLGHVWMSLKGIWPNAPRLILKWEENTDEPKRYS